MPIVPANFVSKNSRWQDLYSHLVSKGFLVYAPEQHVGDCLEPMLIVKNDGSYVHNYYSTDLDMYAILCYVPKLQYSKLDVLLQQVKKAMDDLYPMFRPYGTQTPSAYDDFVKGHYTTIQYVNYKKTTYGF